MNQQNLIIPAIVILCICIASLIFEPDSVQGKTTYKSICKSEITKQE